MSSAAKLQGEIEMVMVSRADQHDAQMLACVTDVSTGDRKTDCLQCKGGRWSAGEGQWQFAFTLAKPNLANVKRGNVERGKDDGRQNGRRVGGNAEYAGMTAV